MKCAGCNLMAFMTDEVYLPRPMDHSLSSIAYSR